MLVAQISAGDLYHVLVHDSQEAALLASRNPDAILRTSQGYLVLVDHQIESQGILDGFESHLVYFNVTREHLALSMRADIAHADRDRLIFEDGLQRLLLVNPATPAAELRQRQILRLGDFRPRIFRPRSTKSAASVVSSNCDFNQLIGHIDTDSLMSYVAHLQSYYRRLAGTPESRAARGWIQDRLLSYGCDSVILQPFDADLDGTITQCWNVLGYKTGLSSPERQVVVGAHYDTKPNAPGADDNGSGTAAVLEIARSVCAEVTDLTYIFALFDAEEFGILGSRYYADSAAARGDDIELMFNMDMIGYIDNDDSAVLFYGFDTNYCHVWGEIAEPTMGISGFLWGALPGSDHYWFGQHGYHVVGLREYTWNPYWHTPSDSIDYLSPYYYTRMTQSALATSYIASHGLLFEADIRVGWAPLTVGFDASCPWPVDEWQWWFGNGDTASGATITKTFSERGLQDITLVARTGGVLKSTKRSGYIAVLDDSLTAIDTEVSSQAAGIVTVSITNTIPLSQLIVPVSLSGDLPLRFDSVSIAGCRTSGFTKQMVHFDPFNNRMTVKLANPGSSQTNLPAGQGPILRLFVFNSETEPSEDSATVSLNGYGSYIPTCIGPLFTYEPRVQMAQVFSGCCMGTRGNVDASADDNITINDLVALVDFMFRGAIAPACMAEADIDASGDMTMADLTWLIGYMYRAGPQPVACGP
jgi:PKD repeat protein